MAQGLPEPTLVPAPVIAWGDFLFKWRNTVFPVVMAVLLLGFRPAGAGQAWDLWVDVFALAVILGGSALRILVVGLAYIKRGGMNKKVYADKLVTEGIFAHGRNPLYIGNLMVLLGILLMHGSPWVLALGGAFYLASYGAIVAAEERFLAAKFGDDYRDYCARVPRCQARHPPVGHARDLPGLLVQLAAGGGQGVQLHLHRRRHGPPGRGRGGPRGEGPGGRASGPVGGGGGDRGGGAARAARTGPQEGRPPQREGRLTFFLSASYVNITRPES